MINMKQVSTYSANQLVNNKPVEGLTLIVNRPLPEKMELGEWYALMDDEADKIVDALVHALPQGLTDRIACKLMSRMVTSFAIPMETK